MPIGDTTLGRVVASIQGSIFLGEMQMDDEELAAASSINYCRLVGRVGTRHLPGST